MKKDPVTRREFILLGTGAAALGAFPAASTLDAAISRPGQEPVGFPDYISSTDTDMETALAVQWAGAYREAATGMKTGGKSGFLQDVLKPPLSFLYGGKRSSDLLPAWRCETQASPDDRGDQVETRYTDPDTGLQVRAVTTRYLDFPAVESILYFKNLGHSETPILEEIQALDAWFMCPDEGPTIHYAKGATCSMNDFMPLTRVLGQKGRLDLHAGGGRSSSEFLPFFNLEANGEGAIAAIGWTGEWAASFDRPQEAPHFQARSGMALTHLKLHPGEEIRTPRILMLFWAGQPQRGHNLLRRFLLAHRRPSHGGQPLPGPITNSNWGGTSAADHIENIRQIVAHDLPMEYYWIDAEWFGKGPWWRNTGNWNVKKDLYPNGFKPISDLLHASGRKFLLWFEPERVCEGTPWYTEHAEWLLEVPGNKRAYRGFSGEGDWDIPQTDPRWVPMESARNQIQKNDRLLNLGIPEARRFLIDFISAKIDEFGIDCYRHDANIAPLEFWRAADASDRQGITEIRWVEGLYAFWDELRSRHPNLVIDDCASGGRRIDFETIGRVDVFSRTDFVGNLLANQCHTYGLLRWVPLGLTTCGNLSKNNEYKIRSSMTNGLSYALFADGDHPQPPADYAAFPFAEVKRSIERYQEVQKFFYGDFYPITEYTQANDAWMAYQLDLPETGEGLLVVLKRPSSEYSEAIYPLNALQAENEYEVVNLDTAGKMTFSGKQLMNKGVEVHLAEKPDSALFRYRRRA